MALKLGWLGGGSTRTRGSAAEDAALAHLRAQGLRLIERNYRTPGRGGGEIDLILREPDGTLVFVEVRARADASCGGAAASIGAVKQRLAQLCGRTIRAGGHINYPLRDPRYWVSGGWSNRRQMV